MVVITPIPFPDKGFGSGMFGLGVFNLVFGQGRFGDGKYGSAMIPPFKNP